jgi:cellulose synthase/poly-beta-1,6-N-acetylglucosamine synthase-like glycosyltransferase
MSDPADYTDMSARPRVSVIVTAYNLDRYLPEALDSALAQESPGGPVQIIVVDDGSTDTTPDVLAAYADRVEVIRQENGGLVKAVDTGLGAVRGEPRCTPPSSPGSRTPRAMAASSPGWSRTTSSPAAPARSARR